MSKASTKAEQCDEKRPCCTRCSTASRECIYATPVAGTATVTKVSPASSNFDALSTSPPPTCPPTSTAASLEPCLRQPLHRSLLSADTTTHSLRPNAHSGMFSDAELFSHFLDHTCRTTASLQDRVVMQIGIGKLALDSMPVFHAVLALSAACICCDMISSRHVELEMLRQTYELGLHHHTISLEQMRILVTNPTKAGSETMLAIAVLLPALALSSLRIQYWMLSATDMQDYASFTPRDAIQLLRGIRPTIFALNSTSAPELEIRQNAQPSDEPWTRLFSSQTAYQPVSSVITGHSHAMFPVLSATYHSALNQLQQRIEINSSQVSPQAEKTSISDAYSFLNNLMTKTFTPASAEDERLAEQATVSSPLLSSLSSPNTGYCMFISLTNTLTLRSTQSPPAASSPKSPAGYKAS